MKPVSVLIWQGYTGIWWWQLNDRKGGLCNRIIDGQAATKNEAKKNAKKALALRRK